MDTESSHHATAFKLRRFTLHVTFATLVYGSNGTIISALGYLLSLIFFSPWMQQWIFNIIIGKLVDVKAEM